MKHLTTDSSTGRPCAAKTWFGLFAAICLFRFAIGGLTLWGVEFPPFDAQGAAWLVGAFGGVYGYRAANKGKEV